MRAIALGFAFLLSQAATSEVINVPRLNQILKAKGATWTAKANPISQASKEEAKLHLGLPAQENSVEFQLPEVKSMANLPSKLDWRNNNGGWVTPILDQGQCGACVAFATVGVLETQYRIATGFAGFNVKLSPQHMFACGGGACQFGWFPEAASRYLMRAGVPDEACMPYISGATGNDMMCNSACADSSQRMVKISNYNSPTKGAKNVEAIKQALQNGPLVTTLMVYADFMAYASGVYKHTTGEAMGGHAISIIGYDDTTRAFAIRNSWGEVWGEKGFGWVSYDDISGVGDSTWGYTFPAVTGGLSISEPMDRTYASGATAMKAHSTYAGTNSISLSIAGSNGQMTELTCGGADCDQQLDTLTLADGRYEVQATAFDSGRKQLGKSARQYFYIANTKPNLTLDFAAIKGADLTRPLKARIEMMVTAKSSTVPMSSVQFFYKGADGQVHSKEASVVADGLIMGWRTDLVPNGQYEIWMTGHLKTAAQDAIIESTHRTVTVAN